MNWSSPSWLDGVWVAVLPTAGRLLNGLVTAVVFMGPPRQ